MADLKEAACGAHRLEEVDVQMWEHHAGRYYGEQPMCARPDKVLGQEPQKVLHRQSIMLLEKACGQPLCCCHDGMDCQHMCHSCARCPRAAKGRSRLLLHWLCIQRTEDALCMRACVCISRFTPNDGWKSTCGLMAVGCCWRAQDESGQFPAVAKESLGSGAGGGGQPIVLGHSPERLGRPEKTAAGSGLPALGSSTFGPSMRSSYNTDVTHMVRLSGPLLASP